MTAWTIRLYTRFMDGRERESLQVKDFYLSTRPDRMANKRERRENHHSGRLWPGQKRCMFSSEGPYEDRPPATPPIEFEVLTTVYDNKEYSGNTFYADRIFKSRAIETVQWAHGPFIVGIAMYHLVGIRPEHHVERTIAGVPADHDEVLESALEIL